MVKFMYKGKKYQCINNDLFYLLTVLHSAYLPPHKIGYDKNGKIDFYQW